MSDLEDGGTEETRWLSYAELAGALVISKRAALRLANRRGWRRQKDDDGRLRVAVPASALEREPKGAVMGSKNQDGADPDRERAIRAEAQVQELMAELNGTRTQLTDLRLREAMARSRAEALQTEVKRLNALLETGLLRRLRGFWRRIRITAWHWPSLGKARMTLITARGRSE